MTRGVYLSQDKKAIGPAIRPNMAALFVVTGTRTVVLREAVALLRSHDITNTPSLSLFIPILFILFLFTLAQLCRKGLPRRVGTEKTVFKVMLPSKNVHLYS